MFNDNSWTSKALRFVGRSPISVAKQFFKPSEKTRTRDVLRELPQAGMDVMYKKPAKLAKEMFVGAPARAISSGLLEFERARRREDVRHPRGRFQKFVFGDRPVRSFTRAGIETKIQAREYGQTEERFAKQAKALGKLSSAQLAYGAAGVGVLDLWLGGKGKATAKALSKVMDFKKVTKMTKGLNLSDDAIKKIAKETDVKKIEKLMKPTSKTPMETVEKAGLSIETDVKDVDKFLKNKGVIISGAGTDNAVIKIPKSLVDKHNLRIGKIPLH